MISRRSVLSLIAALAVLFVTPLIGRAADVPQEFQADKTLVRGTIVGRVAADKKKVEAVGTASADRAFGVVVRSSDAPLSLSETNTGILVSTNGRYEVLVSNLNGQIKAGDSLSVSALAGIGMKTDSRQKLIIGKALQDFDSTRADSVISRIKTKNSDGEVVEAAIGRILVDVRFGANPNAASGQAAPGFLINFGENLTGQVVSPIRIYGSMLVLFIATAIAGSLLYSAIKHSMVAIGRNPLSRASVLHGLAQVVGISIIIFISGLVAVYLILKI